MAYAPAVRHTQTRPEWRSGESRPRLEGGSQDGNGHGTVQSKVDAGWCKVKWDNGGSNEYRVGLRRRRRMRSLLPHSGSLLPHSRSLLPAGPLPLDKGSVPIMGVPTMMGAP
jgi:hypothetical protein